MGIVLPPQKKCVRIETTKMELLAQSLIRLAFQAQVDGDVARKENCSRLRTACSVSKNTRRICSELDATDEFAGVLSRCEPFVQIIDTLFHPEGSLIPTVTKILYMPIDHDPIDMTGLRPGQVYVQDIGQGQFLNLDGALLLPWDDDDGELDRQWALTDYFLTTGKPKLPKGAHVHVFIHIIRYAG